MLHFAYGSNMSRHLMKTHAPDARAIGVARLPGFRFNITRDGYASVLEDSGSEVHGVLWRLTSRDLDSLDAYESIHTGLYRRAMLPVSRGPRPASALVYLARTSATGVALPGYMELVLDAAREWHLPDDYIDSLRRWLGAGAIESGELA